MVDFSTARLNMVESQIRTNKVTDARILDALETVPRETYVPENRRGVCYIDEDLAIGGGRYLMEPMVLARLLQEARIGKEDVVLDVGCATGYSCAVLSKLAATVVGVECDAALAEQANRVLSEEGIDNAVVIQGPLGDGYPKQAPYNVIILEGAVAEVPPAIRDQLADGGRLVAVIRHDEAMGRAILMQRSGDVVSSRILFDAATPSLPGFEREESFVF
ncbi:MAG: protein-L-isoaspartate O-methyltransferase [Rhodovibrionaceae bacterium]